MRYRLLHHLTLEPVGEERVGKINARLRDFYDFTLYQSLLELRQVRPGLRVDDLFHLHLLTLILLIARQPFHHRLHQQLAGLVRQQTVPHGEILPFLDKADDHSVNNLRTEYLHEVIETRMLLRYAIGWRSASQH